MSRDLETMLGEPKKAILSMIIPLAVSYLITQVNLFVDTFWTSGLGADVSSAISTISPIYWMIGAAGTGLGVGASATIAYRFGRGENGAANRLAGNTVLLGILFSVAASILVFVFLDPIITGVGASGIRSECAGYVMPYVFMSWAIIENGVVAGLLRSEGAAKKSMTVLIITAVFNMCLDPVLIYLCDLGIYGAGWATSISALVAMLLGFFWYVKGSMVIKLNRDSFKVDRTDMKEVLVVAAPKTAESAINNIVNMVQRIFIIVAAGTIGAMLYNVPWRYVALAVIPVEAIGASLIPVCSAALGQKSMDKMDVGIRYSIKLTFVITVVISIFIAVFSEYLMAVFTYSDSMLEHKDELVWVLRMYSLLILPYAFTMLGNSILQSLKKSVLATELMLCWGIIKLIGYGLVCSISFEAIIYVMIILHYVSGIAMMWLAFHEKKKKWAIIMAGEPDSFSGNTAE